MTTSADGRGAGSTDPDHDLADDSLVEGAPPLASSPAHPGKQIVLAIAAVVLAASTFLPWWDAEIPLDRVAATLNGWLLLVTGLSIGDLGATTGYNWFGNVLFGLVPIVPVLWLIVLLVLRIGRVFITPANTLFVYALLTAAGSLWMFLFGAMRVDASNGVYPVLAGPWVVLVVCLVLCAFCLGWWRLERVHFPKRGRRGGVAGAVAGNGGADAAGREDAHTTDELFADIGRTDDDGDDLVTFGRDIDGESTPSTDDGPDPTGRRRR